MSLYGGIDVEIAKTDASVSRNNFMMMNQQLMRKAASKLTKSSTSSVHAAAIKHEVALPAVKVKEIFVETDASRAIIKQEYDPLKPNEYSIVNALVQKRKREKKYEEENKKAKPLVSAYDDSDKTGIEEDLDFYEDPKQKKKNGRVSGGGYKGDDDNEYDGPSTTAKGGAMIAPPSSLIEKDKSTLNVLHPEIDAKKLLTQEKKESQGPENVKQMMSMKNVSSVASSIMSKYGWKEGQGLGRDEQGMSSALFVEKTGRSRGVIVNESAETTKARIELAKQEEERKSKAAELNKSLKKPSKVILLKNMVGPGEVDDDLEEETREECSKYGDVIQVVIYEIPSGVVPEEAVRIFVQFSRIESAIKAVVDLHNRYFGGRTVKCMFYSSDKFEALDLAPQPDELPGEGGPS